MSAEALLTISVVLLIAIIVRPDVMLQIVGAAMLVAIPFGGFLPPELVGIIGSGSAIAALLMIGIGRALFSLRTLVLLRRASDPVASQAVHTKRWFF